MDDKHLRKWVILGGSTTLCTADTLNMYELLIWILEDYGTSKWILKHKVTTLELFGKMNIEISTEVCDATYRVIQFI